MSVAERGKWALLVWVWDMMYRCIMVSCTSNLPLDLRMLPDLTGRQVVGFTEFGLFTALFTVQ